MTVPTSTTSTEPMTVPVPDETLISINPAAAPLTSEELIAKFERDLETRPPSWGP